MKEQEAKFLCSNDIELYASRCQTSSRRTRIVIYIILLSCIYSFSFLLNSWQNSWTNQRIKILDSAIELGAWDLKNRQKIVDYAEIKYFDNIRSYLDYNYLNDSIQIQQILSYYQKLKTDNIQNIKVLFFGIMYDINDLGILTGFTFLLLFTWLKFALLREESNLEIVEQLFDTSDTDIQSRMSVLYQLIKMQQLFTTTKVNVNNIFNNNGLFKFIIPKIIFFLPSLILLLIILHDLYSFDFGLIIDSDRSIITMLASFASLSILIFMAFNCYNIFIKTEKFLSKKKVDNAKNSINE